MAKPARALELKASERRELERLHRASSTPAGVSRRARAVLLMADQVPNVEVAQKTGYSVVQVSRLRKRFSEERLEGLEDRPRSGRPRSIGPRQIARVVALTLKPPPKGLTHWSARELAEKIGLSHSTVHRVWQDHNLKPHLVETFKFSRDPEAEAKIRDIVGLYLHPPEKAAVICVDEKTQIQALNRTQPLLPLKPRRPARQTHDYQRNGLTSLFAALDVKRGRVMGECRARHTSADFLSFLKKVARRYRGDLHVVLDNASTHKTPEVNAWLAKHPRIQLHFTPTGASWLNLIEAWFSILTRKSIRRGSFHSVRELVRHIQAYIEHWNGNPVPFVWTKTPDEVVRKAVRT